uniref:SAP30_Sin3_bdg domain-containing protein n=1 Tax=Caenorhabditis tropicalis TaxID=1561998 RepID=A0A1I7T2L6_9PELO
MKSSSIQQGITIVVDDEDTMDRETQRTNACKRCSPSSSSSFSSPSPRSHLDKDQEAYYRRATEFLPTMDEDQVHQALKRFCHPFRKNSAASLNRACQNVGSTGERRQKSSRISQRTHMLDDKVVNYYKKHIIKNLHANEMSTDRKDDD